MYRMSQKAKKRIAENIVAFMTDDTPLLQESVSFICNWVMTDGAEKTRTYYDVWDLVLKIYLPPERPVLFRSCQRLSNREIQSFTGRIYTAERFSENHTGHLLICDTEEYLQFAKIPYEKEELEKILHFTDEYINGGYGKSNEKIQTVIRENMIKYGIPMDETYVGKAFWGMKEWMQKEGIRGKNVLFIHTGGTPLFFDFLRRE